MSRGDISRKLAESRSVRAVLEWIGLALLALLLTSVAFALFLFSCAVFGACAL